MTTETMLPLEADLERRLAAIAKREGTTVHDLAAQVLRAHADQAERDSEYAEDDARWQRFLDTGEAIPYEKIQEKLRRLAGEVEPR